jgi:hypothetical protein
MVSFESGQGRTATATPQPTQGQQHLRIKHPGRGEPVRLAVAALCDLRPSLPDPDLSSLLLEGRRGEFRQHTYPVLMECIEAACALHDRAVMEPGRGKVIWRRYLPLRYSSICAKGMRQVAGSGQL